MVFNIINDIFSWLDRTFKQIEEFIQNHYDNPLLWVMIVVMLLLIAAMAWQTLSKDR